jgi:hypothetical protein
MGAADARHYASNWRGIYMRIFAIIFWGVFLSIGAQPALLIQAKPIPMPEVQSIAEGVIWRISDKKDTHGSYLPPWKEVRIANIFFKLKPSAGSKITVIPLDIGINPFDLKIVKAEKQKFGCDESLPEWWEVELEPITRKEFFEVSAPPNRREEVPFDVVVIYPTVKFAHQIKKEQLAKDMVPKGVSINTIKAAIDVTNDQKPDILMAEFCCNDSSKTEECDYTCGKRFKKVNGRWKLIYEYAPC